MTDYYRLGGQEEGTWTTSALAAHRWPFDPGGRQNAPLNEFVEANAEELPFEAGSFDAYTIAFGIRNVPRIDRALAEAHRVLRRGGRFLCLEFSSVDVPGLDRLYDLYSFNVIPQVGRTVTGDELHFRLDQGRIAYIPLTELFELAKAQTQRKGSSSIANRPSSAETPGRS